MKNLFKNLMLVAVAAMAFTACEKGNDDVNKNEEKVVLEFTAGFADDTRVAFGDSESLGDNDYRFPTKWEAGDVITIEYAGKTTTCTLTAEDIANEGASASIKAEFTLGAEEILPASGLLVATVGGAAPEVQDGTKPAHSLRASVDYPSDTLTFEHQVAYGKMSIVGLPDGFDLTTVDLTLNYKNNYGYADTKNISINTTSVTDIWFTTEAMTVTSFVVNATDSNDDTYSKEVTIGENPLNFTKGAVSIFSVSGLEGGAIVIDGELLSAIATLGTKGGDNNYHTVTFTRNDAAELSFELRTDGKSFLKLGNYTNDWSSYSSGAYDGYINYARINGAYMSVADLTVAYNETEQYIITFSYGDVDYRYTGAIEGLDAPKAMTLSETSLSFEAAGGSSDITVTTENTTGEIVAESSNAQFTVTVNGKTVTVAADENTTSNAINGTVTITCDGLTATVKVSQAGVGGVVADGTTIEKAYTFSSYTISYDWGYPVLIFGAAEDGYTFEIESNHKDGFPTDLQKFNGGSWYTAWLKYIDPDGNTVELDLEHSYTYFDTSGSGYTVEYIMIVTSTGSKTFYKYDGVISL